MKYSTYVKQLLCILKKFNGIPTLTNELLIRNFPDNLRLSIRAQFDEKDRNLDN